MLQQQVLSAEHHELSAVASALVAEAEADRPRPECVAAHRWELTRKLLAHLAKEDRLLYPRLMAHRDNTVAVTARRFAHEMGGLADAYNDHVRQWTAPRMLEDWPGYAAATRVLVARLHRRIEREETELYPLLTKLGETAD